MPSIEWAYQPSNDVLLESKHVIMNWYHRDVVVNVFGERRGINPVRTACSEHIFDLAVPLSSPDTRPYLLFEEGTDTKRL